MRHYIVYRLINMYMSPNRMEHPALDSHAMRYVPDTSSLWRYIRIRNNNVYLQHGISVDR